eukprot:gene16328-22517_t
MNPVDAVVYVLDGVFVGASDFQFLVAAMALASSSTAVLLLAIEPLGLGLEGVWEALAVLMVGRVTTLTYRYQMADGPLPPLGSKSQASSSESELEPGAFPEYLEEETGTWVPLETSLQALETSLLLPAQESRGKDEETATSHEEDSPTNLSSSSSSHTSEGSDETAEFVVNGKAAGQRQSPTRDSDPSLVGRGKSGSRSSLDDPS